ncbi:aminoacyl tRNA synthase complex-interacting multifunctional protein 1-like isoform X1 [Corythoichthys intestinalis]|uniref:aminoacyl tRNA synthase complex-interacting multifunctional protein 1-like isoform X1 n=1 Tax=Corythoichthys intestinalis TaxID=161448 RepID=UPI0025A5A46A|nr:aminoacyl tRNA synthase complex-interacting multifunctional protein 1-like isoform X1 [Corythoichthys intestinalis]XP_061792082.1 aminoacyl tRNA synthase complex-interacting multifunctional protein 1-like [Nerophis lumbriciformis]
MGRSGELSEFQRGTVVGCHMCNKSLRQIANLLNLPRSTVNNVIVQWKRERRTCPLPRCGRPHKLKEEDRQVLERLAQERTFPSMAALTAEFRRASGVNVSKATVTRELREMGLTLRSSNEGRVKERKRVPKTTEVCAEAKVEMDEQHQTDMSHLDLRVGCIIRTMQLPGTDSLYVQHVDVGEAHPRTVVSERVPVNLLQNCMAVLLCNLKPAQIRGVASQAAVVCVSSANGLEILAPPNGAVPGDKVTVDGFTGDPDKELEPAKVCEHIGFDLRTDDQCVATYKDVPLEVVGKGVCRAPTLRDCQVVLTEGRWQEEAEAFF